MKVTLVFYFLILTLLPVHSQENKMHEVGLDLNFGASNFNGSAGFGLKYGVLKNETFIFGPSVRYQRTWSNYSGNKFGYNIYGGGAFIHVRLYDYFFAGAEVEFLKSPLVYNTLTPPSNWIPTAFVGGGFSHEFNEAIRVNAGIMYDVVDHGNSPFRLAYNMKKANGILIPVIYRIAFFFPLH